jgi:purine nucleosidase
MAESRQEVIHLLKLMDLDGDVTVADGAPAAMTDEGTPADSPGARLIVQASHEPGPLFVLFLGPLTDMAAAILLDPAIVHNPELTVVWIGGTPYDGVHGETFGEFNLSNDVTAANVVLQSGVRVWQIPWTVYAMVNVGYVELDEKVAPHGELGAYLVRQLKEFNAAFWDSEIEHHSLGDSPAVGVVLNPLSARWRHHPVRVFDEHARMTSVVVEGRTVKVADAMDVRFLLEDFFAKIKAQAASPSARASQEKRS